VSLIVTKRDEFASVLGHEGLDGLMKRMHATLDGMPKGA
jgi:ABC-type transporter MlaC component